MKIAVFASLLGLAACSTHHANQVGQALTCASDQTAVYTNRFTPEAGSSGVASAPAALAGAINGTTAADGSTPSVPDEPVTAMTATCAPSQCDPGQVAVEIPPAPTNGGGVEGPASTGAEPGGVAGPVGSDTPSTGAPEATPIATTTTSTSTTVCVAAPPACPTGESPQYTSHGTWECTDCALVVTYGSQYGNYRRCVNSPTIVCNSGDVPTWDYTDEAWECQPTCDNGEYDQHMIDNQLVCVPC